MASQGLKMKVLMQNSDRLYKIRQFGKWEMLNSYTLGLIFNGLTLTDIEID